jgi:hypothetical protein
VSWIRIARALLGALVLVPFACGPRAEPPKVAADAPPIDSCALLPEEEAIQLAGEDLDPVSTALDRRVDREIAKCSYANLGGPPFRMISLEVRRYPTPELAREAQESTLKFLRRIEQDGAEDIAGLGDSALWGANSQQLHALTQDLRLIVTVQLGDRRFRGESAREITSRALERLAGGKLPAPGVPPAAPGVDTPG